MKLKLLLPLLFLIKTAWGQEPNIFIAGTVKSNLDSVKIKLGIWDNYITGQVNEAKYEDISSGNGTFSIKLSRTYPVRIVLYDRLTFNQLIDNEQMIIEPNDSIYITASINEATNNKDSILDVHFSGRGSEKYNLVRKLNAIRNEEIFDTEIPFSKRAVLGEKLIKEKLELLNKTKTSLTDYIYNTYKADIEAKIKESILFNEYARLAFGSKLTKEQLNNKDFILSYINKDFSIPFEAKANSPVYVKYLVLKERIKLYYEFQDSSFTIKDLYKNIKNSYESGVLRDKLLAYALLSPEEALYFRGHDASEYTFSLKDAIESCQTPSIKSTLLKTLNSKGQGSPVLDFTLPMDSSGRKFTLSDLRGKVVLVDMWGYICTGCYLFNNVFHKKIYPYFKDNPNFQVVSVMIDQYADKDKYIGRLRGLGGPIYTYPEYINLYGGKGENEARKIEKYYDINSVPYIMIIDKKGKIYSSSVPFFTEPDSKEIEKLKTLILAALSE